MGNENDELYRNLVILLRMFKNRPHHLAKYLVDNSALTSEFIKTIKDSQKLKEISEDDDDKIYFTDISQMENYFNAFTEAPTKEKGIKETTKELNDKLNECIKLEKYEDAARIRDYMIRNGIKRN